MSFLTEEHVLEINDQQEMVGILGRNDEFLRLIELEFPAAVMARGNKIIFNGTEEQNEQLDQLFRELLFLYRQGLPITGHDVRYSIYMVQSGQSGKLHDMYASSLLTTWRGRQIKAKTLGQWDYVRAIKNNFITFGIGPAGTGKTYLAVAMAVEALKRRQVERIILTRPAVEAGEKLGFLPGDMQEKVDPYLRPLYDALYQIMGAESFAKNMEKGLIEVAPLAYMRGRTLDNAYIILDEAQNTTPAQMKMFLTRIGFGSKVIVTGDSSQKDLPVGAKSGLDVAARVLKNIDDIAFCNLTNKDVVRHPLVQKIVKAYDDYEARTKRR